MSTRCSVGPVDSDGRYIHFDGYPNGVGCMLIKYIVRDGPKKVIDTIMSEGSWSYLNDKNVSCELENFMSSVYGDSNASDRKRFEYVEGYGKAYADNRWTSISIKDDTCDYHYRISLGGLINVYNGQGDLLNTVNVYDANSYEIMTSIV